MPYQPVSARPWEPNAARWSQDQPYSSRLPLGPPDSHVQALPVLPALTHGDRWQNQSQSSRRPATDDRQLSAVPAKRSFAETICDQSGAQQSRRRFEDDRHTRHDALGYPDHSQNTLSEYHSLLHIVDEIDQEIDQHETLVMGEVTTRRPSQFSDISFAKLSARLSHIRDRMQDSNENLQVLLKTKLGKGTEARTSTRLPRCGGIEGKARHSSSCVSNLHNSSSFGPSRAQLSKERSSSASSITQDAASALSSRGVDTPSQTSPISPVFSAVSTDFSRIENWQELGQKLSDTSHAHATATAECAALQEQLAAGERKLEATVAKNIALFAEKDGLMDRITCLELREQELVQECAEARRANEKNKEQYLRMIEMASKLQERKRAAAMAEDGSASDGDDAASDGTKTQRRPDAQKVPTGLATPATTLPASSSLSRPTHDAMLSLRNRQLESEVARLQARNTRLETVLADAKAATLRMAVHGQNLAAELGKALPAPVQTAQSLNGARS